MESDSLPLCRINMERYRAITNCTSSYDGTDKFDKECGLSYYTEQIKEKTYEDCFYFRIIDKKKYLIAKLKYGI